MRPGAVIDRFRPLTWCCVVLLAVLSLLPARETILTRGVPHPLAHFVAYAGSTTIAMIGYGRRWSGTWIVGWFSLYGGILEFLQHFSPGRNPEIRDFAGSALGALSGVLAVTFLRRRFGNVRR
jgi:VanZ family protein